MASEEGIRMASEQDFSAPGTGQAPGPLDGFRVVDLTHVIAGPTCTQLLGDMGADIIKVETKEGDLTRSLGPQRSEGMSANFLIFNRNKRSVVLDLGNPEGQAALKRILKTAHAVVVNRRRDVLERLAIDYATIAVDNPHLVYCRIVGYRSQSSRQDVAAVDDIIQAMSGVAYLQDRLTGKPSFIALPVADLVAGLFALSGILAALLRQRETGKGEEVEVSMYEAMAYFMLSPHLGGHCFEPPLGEPIYQRSVANRGPFDSADGAICMAPLTDLQWRRFLPMVGLEEVLRDPKFATIYARAQNLDQLYAMVAPRIKNRTTAEWLQLLSAESIPCAPLQTTEDLVNDAELREGLFDQLEHPTEGQVRLMRNPVRFTQAPGGLRWLPPPLGAHTEQILAEVGYTAEELRPLDG
jgi:crotonobetainyl-CoA:carnitine CoA-transferase CaiB-like acyl-CoA transferase